MSKSEHRCICERVRWWRCTPFNIRLEQYPKQLCQRITAKKKKYAKMSHSFRSRVGSVSLRKVSSTEPFAFDGPRFSDSTLHVWTTTVHLVIMPAKKSAAAPPETAATAAATPSKSTKPNKPISTSSLISIANAVWDSYVTSTPQRTKLVDVFMGFLVVTGVLQFVYCVIAGNYV